MYYIVGMRTYNMSKIIVLKGGRADNNMANMSASILREVVARSLNVKATSIVLSGEISPDTSFTGNTCWSSQTTEHYFQLFGFNPQQGLVNLNECVGNWHNASDGTQHGVDGTSICNIKDVEQYIFFVVIEDIRAYDERWSEYSIKLYKAPDFKSHWAKIEEKDIARWEQWLAE